MKTLLLIARIGEYIQRPQNCQKDRLATVRLLPLGVRWGLKSLSLLSDNFYNVACCYQQGPHKLHKACCK